MQISNIKFVELFFSLYRLQEGHHHPKKVTWYDIHNIHVNFFSIYVKFLVLIW